jgi:hypothetical protein
MPAAVFRTEGSNSVDITMPAHRMTMRRGILKGGGQTRMLDYYEIVSRGGAWCATIRTNRRRPVCIGMPAHRRQSRLRVVAATESSH